MQDFNKMSAMMKNLFPSDPVADKKALMEMANQPQDAVTPTKDYIKESVEVPQGSMPLGIDSVSDFAKLAGIIVEGHQKTGSAGQAKGKDPMPKLSKPTTGNETPHPLKDKLVGEDDDLSLGKLQTGARALDLDDNNMMVGLALKKAVNGDVLTPSQRDALKPYVDLFAHIIEKPELRVRLQAMDKMLKSEEERKKDPQDTETKESGLQYYTGVKKYGKEGMQKIQSAAGKGANHEEIGKIKDKYDKTRKQESIKERLYTLLNGMK